MDFDCVIIGAGPAGYCAAIYASRAELKPILYTGNCPGGQLTTTNEVENFPGYNLGVTGFQLMINFRKQAERFNTIIKEQRIIKIDFFKKNGSKHSLYSNIGEKIQTKGVIIATGSNAKLLGLESEARLMGKGVSTCATCDGFFYKEKVVAVIGGGDSSLVESIYLSKICKKVHLIVRKGELCASKIMEHRANNIFNIKIHYKNEIKEILGKNSVEGIRIQNKDTAKSIILFLEAIFIAIGHRPNTSIFKHQLRLNENGYIITNNGGTSTDIPGVFAAGDVQDSIYRQAITSAGSGCMAALELDQYLLSLKTKRHIFI